VLIVDLRYGTSPHGGYGLGLERFLAWILNRSTVRECVPYPNMLDIGTTISYIVAEFVADRLQCAMSDKKVLNDPPI
jgi:hypothetical protein